jgi:small subunit ribosomal protein S6
MNFRRYETYILLSPNLSADQLAAFKTKVRGILSKGEAQIVHFDEKGRQKLAYPVNKELYGYYVLFDYRAKSDLALELERNLKIDEQVFKYLTVVLDKNFTQEKYQAVLDAIASEKAKKEKEQQSHAAAQSGQPQGKPEDKSEELADGQEGASSSESGDSPVSADSLEGGQSSETGGSPVSAESPEGGDSPESADSPESGDGGNVEGVEDPAPADNLIDSTDAAPAGETN